MPYIKNGLRNVIRDREQIPDNPGELNYLITDIIQEYYHCHGNYQAINDILGALEGAKLEFYRRVAALYENKKIKENGDVYNDRNAILRSETEAGAKAA